MRLLVTPRFTRASASQLKCPLIREVSWCLEQEQATELFGKEAREAIARKGLREDRTSPPQKDTSDKETETGDSSAAGV